MSFVFASFIVFASSPNVGRGLESTSSSTLNLVVEMSMDRSKAEEKFLAPVAEDIEKVRHFRNLRQRPTGLSTTRQQQHVTVTWNATKEIARLDNDNTPW
ncbi:hypothetical protein IV203_010622 [Nitzschia inconspicua]|uniref:Uncharacterized protein n=1 Tax=Nitzschia inconspicua TaxID=303405 RepID=A0A9K3KXI1_9STRA|nr:hypothetical protein IV203_010622 [Nitzschia inconspicua]